jgi:hypothetical protein
MDLVGHNIWDGDRRERTHQSSDGIMRFVYYDPCNTVRSTEGVERPLVGRVINPFRADVEQPRVGVPSLVCEKVQTVGVIAVGPLC